MQKRLFGILASVAIIVAACGGATASIGAARVDRTRSLDGAPAEAPSTAPNANGGGPDPAHRPRTTSRRPSTPARPRTRLDRGPARPERGLVYFDKDLKVVPELGVSRGISRLTARPHLPPADAKYSNGDPIVAGDLVYSWKRLVDPRTAAPYSYVMAEDRRRLRPA